MSALKKNIAILCSRLNLPGGIERAVVNTAALFAQKGHAVTILVLDDTKDSFYPLPENVRLEQQPLSFGITPEGNVITRKIKLLSDVLKLRRIIRSLQADLIIASEYPFAAAAILAGAHKYTKVVSWEHHHYYELKRNLFWNKIFRITYPRLHAVVCLNKDEQRLFSPVNANAVVIPNFITPEVQENEQKKIILTVARLTAVKGIRFLMEVAAKILHTHPDWQWKLIGNGELKAEVLAFIEREKLSSQFILQSPTGHAITHEYRQSSLYVMTSVNECFPMTLLEAQAAGLPCIAFDCESGPRHIITTDTGMLVNKEDTAALAVAIASLIHDEEKRISMGIKAKENILRFAPGNVYELWKEKVFTL